MNISDIKILQIGKFYPIRGGVEKVMYDLTLGLSERGIHCDMLCATTEGHPGGIIPLNKHGRVIALPTMVKAAATTIAPQMVTKLRQIAKDYDVIHIHHPDPMACLALFLSGYKGKVILHWHSDILKQKTMLRLYSPLQNWLIRRADLILGTSPTYVEQSPFLQTVKHKIDFLPIGVPPVEADEQRIAHIRGQYPNKRIIFTLGRLVEYKGYEYLVRAAQSLPDDVIVLIGGIGPLKEQLTQLIEQLNVHEKVKLIGFVSDEDLPAYYHVAQLFVLSSIMKTEAFAIVQIEAMSCGKPVVSCHIPGSGVSWVNQDGISGLVVEKENPQALAEALNKVLSDPNLYSNLAEGAKKRYEELFTNKKMINKCIEQIEKHLFSN